MDDNEEIDEETIFSNLLISMGVESWDPLVLPALSQYARS